ncbi:MAG: cyclic nucleotide-binding domain-containing protein [Treponema sp.]|jgi:diguanylate cyclase (GGDEF)-like protein|nr:cyclic nucleotide-binding domain-containing protein [Treponema sp.]
MSDIKIDTALIQKTELFSNLPQNEIDFITSHSGTISLSKNNLLFSAGEKASRFYILTNGEIRVFKKNDDNSEEEMARFTTGDTIGDFDFARGAEYDAFAEAAEDSQLIVFPASDLSIDSLADEEPQIVCSILQKAIVMMTARIKSVNKLLLDNMSWVQELHRRAYEDAGTGLWKQIIIDDEIKAKLTNPAALIMLKPDRFKILVDSRGHSAGDEAMVRIAIILKNICRHMEYIPGGFGWPLRFKSNEVGIIFYNSDPAQTIKFAEQIAEEIAAMEPVPAMNDIPEFHFSATISWCIWPLDGRDWDSLFQGNYSNLLDTWKKNGNTIVRYSKTKPKGLKEA